MAEGNGHELELVRIRPVETSDATALAVLYLRLDSCNGTADIVDRVIRESRRSLMSPTFSSLTLVAELLDKHLVSKGIAATARLILLGGSDMENAPLMYEEAQNGLILVRRSDHPSLEMAGMVTSPEYEGRGFGKALTAVRANIARTFTGITGTDRILVEFLPPYDDPVKKVNAFWRELIVSHLVESGRLDDAMQRCSELTRQTIETSDDLAQVLVKADVIVRNTMIKEFFPESIPAQKITAAVRQVTADVGVETKGALVNLQRMYGSGTFSLTGMFPIDGGPNYETSAMYGALGDRTVRTSYTEDSNPEDQRIMVETSEKLLVWTPQAPTQRGLRDSSWIVTPGILGPKAVKLPRPVSDLTHVSEGEESSVFRLPLSSSRQRL